VGLENDQRNPCSMCVALLPTPRGWGKRHNCIALLPIQMVHSNYQPNIFPQQTPEGIHWRMMLITRLTFKLVKYIWWGGYERHNEKLACRKFFPMTILCMQTICLTLEDPLASQ